MNWNSFFRLLRLLDQTQNSDWSDWEKIAVYLFIEVAFILAIIALLLRSA
jgi:hypothetical protein